MPWATTDPTFAAAPGFAGYQPTAAYQYVPTGGAFSPGEGLFTTPGVIGGGTTTGGGGASTLGGLLSAASTLGTLNNISKLFTDKGLLDHAGIDLKSIPNPFSNFLGGDGLNLQALNPFSDTPLSGLFGEAAPTALPSNSGLGTFWGDSAASQAFRNANNIYPSYGASTELGTAALTEAQGAAMADALGGAEGYFNTASPWGNPDFGTAPLGDVFGPYDLGTTSVPYGSPTAGEFGPYHSQMQYTYPDLGTHKMPAAWKDASAEAMSDAILGLGKAPVDPSLTITTSNPYSVYGGPTPSATIAEAAKGVAGMTPALSNAYLSGAIPEFAGMGFGASAPGAGSFLGAGALGPLGLALGLYGIVSGMKKDDPTINAKIAAEGRRNAEAAMKGDAGALASIKARLFGDSAAGGENAGELFKMASSGGTEITSGWQGYAPYGTPQSERPHHVIGWPKEVSDWYRDTFLTEEGGKPNLQSTIHSTRDQIVGRREAQDPLQLSPFVDTTTPRMTPLLPDGSINLSAVQGMDGPVDLAMAAKINEQRGGMTPEEAGLFYAQTGSMPAGFYDWRNDPNSRFYTDPWEGPN